MTRRELAREVTKFCYDNKIFDNEKHYYAEMLDAVEINLRKVDYIETVIVLLDKKINKNNKYITEIKKMKWLSRQLEKEKMRCSIEKK